MENQLIPVSSLTVGTELTQTVNARELHEFLEVGRDFSNWIKDQISRARLIENRDFVKVAEKGELSKTGQTHIDYHLTIDSGKHIAMMCGTDKGFEVRDYFLECERLAKNPITMLNDPATLKALLLANIAQVEEQQKQLALAQPKVEFYDAVTDSTDTIDMGQAAKVLNIPGVGRNTLFALLRGVDILDTKNIPKQEYVDRGYFRVIETSYCKPDGTQHINLKTIVYQRGLDYIRTVVDRNMSGGKLLSADQWRLHSKPKHRAGRKRRAAHERRKAA